MEKPLKLSRRGFLLGRYERPSGVRPPGIAQSGLDCCTGCGACAKACPTGIITIAGNIPVLSFSQGECTFCGACAEICPEPVFDRQFPVGFAHVATISANCFPKSGIACQTCRDACPKDAIRFRPRVGGPFLPEIDEAACNGCGACVAPCPAGAIGIAARDPEPTYA